MPDEYAFDGKLCVEIFNPKCITSKLPLFNSSSEFHDQLLQKAYCRQKAYIKNVCLEYCICKVLFYILYRISTACSDER